MHRTRPQTYALIAAVGLITAALITALLMRPGQRDPEPAATGAATTTLSAVPASTANAASATSSNDPRGQALEQFAQLYADPTLDDAAWIESLKPYVTPALLASLRTTDRDIATASGNSIIDTTDTSATIGPGPTRYILTYAQVPTSDDGTATTPVISAITYTDPPKGKALPLTATASEDVRPQLNNAAIAILGLPGGTTDTTRADTIRATFTDPQLALATPRTGAEDVSIRIGSIQSIEFDASDDGRLMAYVVLPYAPDGSLNVQWVTLTVYLSRANDGTWLCQDATY